MCFLERDALVQSSQLLRIPVVRGGRIAHLTLTVIRSRETEPVELPRYRDRR